MADLEKSHQEENLKELMDFASMPVTSKSSVVWDVSVLVKSQAAISRLTSVNHLVEVDMSENKYVA